MNNQALIKQIQYKFRRGLKETDMLFAKFQEKYFASLMEQELAELNLILDKTDQDLIYLFIEKNISNPTPLEQKLLNTFSSK
ncbi:MAG TPA: hypothetical protein DCL21_05760 [Alphaproteobacteria bacterium]|nr:hypothetical protein [Alphaproteobacteria bacterium]